jgi:two-component system chemotaxis response regulator CheY
MRNELLVIDAADLHLSILRKIAAQANFDTTGAASVGAAASLLRERHCDCITLDLSLGERSGVEILVLLAELKCRTPVIVISGSGEDTCAETVKLGHSLDLNLCPPVPKPIHLAGLREMLKQIAADASVQKSATAAGG